MAQYRSENMTEKNGSKDQDKRQKPQKKQTKGILTMFHNLNYKLYVMLCSCNLKRFRKFQVFDNYPNGG